MRSRKIFAASCLLSLTAMLGPGLAAQQGWSQAVTITRNGKQASVNSVYYTGEEVWVVGANGLVARSYDDARTFHEIDLRIDAGLNDVFVRGESVWIVGDAGTILVSHDGGRGFIKSLHSSYRSGSDPLDLYSVQFVDSDKGFIVGDQGLILSSTNGGVSWSEQKSGTDAQLFHLSLQRKNGWVVGTGGTILRTRDGGRNWYRQDSGISDDLNRVYNVTEEIVLITGDNGTLLRTEDGGTTWER
ncbi:MAG TPA: YCF48-related protein, partial [Blastocatellia bacterium]|nr:YCF48-related protein [Blastocatellia bacterium]